jgi:hypothetical protein
MKIQDLKVVYICPDHNEKYRARKEHMDALLTSIGFRQFEHFKSSTAAYPDCLSQATIDILKANMDQPVLILEDDVEFTGIDVFDMIEDVDAIYFGLSTSAGHPANNIHHGPAQYTCYSKSQVRIINMLGGHATLYISPAYKTAVIKTLETYMGKTWYNDVLISRLHNQFLILANRQPSFYQAAKFNKTDHEERNTKIEFNAKPLETTVVTAFYPLRSKHSIEKYIEWMKYFCQIQCSLVVFTDEKMAPIFNKLRRGLPTTVIVKPLDSYEMTNSTWQPLWEKHHALDPEKHIHTPALYSIWAIKQECVALTIQANPFNTEWFVWCDIGIHRDPSKHGLYVEFPLKVPELCKPGHIGLLEINPISNTFLNSTEILAAPKVSLGGGCIVGDRAAWAIFCAGYKTMLMTMDTRGEFIGKDQTVFFRMVVEKVMPFRLFHPDRSTPVDFQWMQLPCILAGTIKADMDERFKNNPKVSFVKLIGGLGNQLFQIAAAYAHAKRRGAALQLSGDVDFGQGRPSYFTTFLHQCRQYISPAPNVPTVHEPHFHYAPIPPNAQSIFGYYQSSRYFADVSGNVKALFDPHPIIKSVTASKYGVYLTTEARRKTIIMHVRRGDYMIPSKKDLHGILTPLYYRAAMAWHRDRLGSEAQFLIFSDDTEYCKATYGNETGVTCIDEPNECVAMHFMSQFQYYILSNSSFSWWATYLGAETITAVAPDRWFGPLGPPDIQDIYEPSWVRLKAE